MTPDEIDRILAEAAKRASPDDGAPDAMVRRAEDAILADLRPVRPLASAWVFTMVLVAIFLAFAAVSGLVLGLHGLAALDAAQIALILPALLCTAWLAAAACVREMSPAAGPRLNVIALALAAAGFPILFALVFHGYSSRDLVKEGVPCLVTGLCVAIPTGLTIALIFRRGFVLAWSAAGLAAGVLSGLAGLGTLELHCANLKAIHVIIWHVGVVLVSGLFGFGSGRIVDSYRANSAR